MLWNQESIFARPDPREKQFNSFHSSFPLLKTISFASLLGTSHGDQKTRKIIFDDFSDFNAKKNFKAFRGCAVKNKNNKLTKSRQASRTLEPNDDDEEEEVNN